LLVGSPLLLTIAAAAPVPRRAEGANKSLQRAPFQAYPQVLTSRAARGVDDERSAPAGFELTVKTAGLKAPCRVGGGGKKETSAAVKVAPRRVQIARARGADRAASLQSRSPERTDRLQRPCDT
jgi:hypothetical protein